MGSSCETDLLAVIGFVLRNGPRGRDWLRSANLASSRGCALTADLATATAVAQPGKSTTTTPPKKLTDL